MSELTEYDYTFLKGDEKAWPHWGAAMSVVMSYCRGKGFGGFGDPTEQGKIAMKEYEDARENLGSG